VDDRFSAETYHKTLMKVCENLLGIRILMPLNLFHLFSIQQQFLMASKSS